MEAVKLFSKSDAEAKIKELAKKRADGGPDRREQALQIAWVWGINKGDVHELFDDAERVVSQRKKREEEETQAVSSKNPEMQPSVAPKIEPTVKGDWSGWRRPWRLKHLSPSPNPSQSPRKENQERPRPSPRLR